MAHLSETDLALLYYGELTAPEERDARAHLQRCEACHAQHDELLRLFALVNSYSVPEPSAEFETQVWRRLQPALRAARMPRRAGIAARVREWLVPSSSRWALAGAMAMLLILAFGAGRYLHVDEPSTPATQSAAATPESLRERILLTALGDHFDRTQGMLVDLASARAGDTIDISGERRRADDLLAATRLYRRAANEAGDRNVANVLEALERVLVEITVSPARLSPYELTSLQRRIENQELLFKLRIAASAIREREQAIRPAAIRGSAGA